MQNITLKSINTKIKSLGDAEKITKALLGELSRELIFYVLDVTTGEVDGEEVSVIGENATFDIDTINRCIQVLTPMNKKTACLYFSNFMPFSFDEEASRFGGMDKNKKRLAKKVGMLGEFLADEDKNIWTWAQENIKVKQKPVDYTKKISSDIKNALDEDKGNLSAEEVLNAIMEGGLTGADIVACLGLIAEQADEQVAA